MWSETEVDDRRAQPTDASMPRTMLMCEGSPVTAVPGAIRSEAHDFTIDCQSTNRIRHCLRQTDDQPVTVSRRRITETTVTYTSRSSAYLTDGTTSRNVRPMRISSTICVCC
jgi:hypothetical protein